MGEIIRRTLEFKDFKFDTEQGIFEGYASIFNKVDSYNEVVMPGAFKKHLSFFKKEGKILWQHNADWPIGLPLKVKEDEKGLFIKAQITKNTQIGAETIALIREKIVNKLSFGYKLIKYEDDTETGIRKLLEIKVYDVSPVTFPAMSLAEITTIKAIRNGKEFKLIEKDKDKDKDEVKKVIPYEKTPVVSLDTPWDGEAEVDKAEISDLKKMCLWYDVENPNVKSSYQLPHHKSDEKYSLVWNGLRAAMGGLLFFMGGMDISVDEKKGCYNHAVKHYKDLDKEPPEWKEGLPWAEIEWKEGEKEYFEMIRFTQNVVSIENYLKMLIKDERDLSEVQDKINGLVNLFSKQTDVDETKTEVTPELIVKLVTEKVEKSIKKILE